MVDETEYIFFFNSGKFFKTQNDAQSFNLIFRLHDKCISCCKLRSRIHKLLGTTSVFVDQQWYAT